MDVLSNVLDVIRLSGAVFFSAEFSAPFSVASPPAEELSPLLMPSAEALALFHVLARGSCWIEMEGGEPFRMQEGEVIVFPHGHAHAMSSEPGSQATPIGSLLPRPPVAAPMPEVVYGGGGASARFVCGYLHCSQRFNPLFASLPPLLWVRRRHGEAAVEPVGDAPHRGESAIPAEAGTWLDTTLRYTIAEASSSRPGNGAMLTRLTELLFVEVLRQYMRQLPATQTGWLAGLSDPQIGRALQLLHAEPARAWTVEELAHAAGASRSTLAERFSKRLGESPAHYLTRWRMQLARQLLVETDLGLAEVAVRVGYDSEAAFNRAFKRDAGEPPATWRKRVARQRHM